MNRVPSGTKEGVAPAWSFFRPFGALRSFHPQPTVETVGYCRSSLTGLSARCSCAVQPAVHRLQPQLRYSRRLHQETSSNGQGMFGGVFRDKW